MKKQPASIADQMRLSSALTFALQPDGLMADLERTDEQLSPEQDQAQQDLYRCYQENPDLALLSLAFSPDSAYHSPSVRFVGRIAREFVRQLTCHPACEELRERTPVVLTPETSAELRQQAPFLLGQEYLNDDWLQGVWHSLADAFRTEISHSPLSVADYLAARHTALRPVGKIFFHLVESRREDYPFAFLATYASGVDAAGQVRHLPLKNALIEFRADRQRFIQLLTTVHRAAEKSQLIRGFLDSDEIFQPLGMSAGEAYVFLREIPLYESCGILCRMPDWWKKRSAAARVTIRIGNQHVTSMGLDTLVDFDASLQLGDLPLTADEMRQMLSEAEGLMLIKGRWIEVDHDRLKAALQAYDRAQKLVGREGIPLIEALRLQLIHDKDLKTSETTDTVEINQGEWLSGLLHQLSSARLEETADAGSAFLAELRPYQSRGLTWLNQMKQLRLGACLADDMGLGKTVQIIALLNAIRSREPEKTLLVVPASLIANWKAEIRRFAPALRLGILHASEQEDYFEKPENLADIDILLTTYGMLGRKDWLLKTKWDNLILDEAQAIKNPSTRQSKLVRQIPAGWRVVLTGTPIENRLSDLWSLFDFTNRGLLGSAQEFSSYTQRLMTAQSDFSRLRNLISPFLLRRLKTDPTIIRDLPEKIEMKTYAGLSKKQVVLYQGVVDDLQKKLNGDLAAMERRGLVLASLIRFKQICNHPDQYLGQTQFHETESGKFTRLREICEVISEKKERVLVFTQFREMTEPLQAFLSDVFGHPGLVLHGGTSVARRREIVADFQGNAYIPFLVLSVKAGGVGLNLTAANHVVHFDRWWNPAVENQATDRAFRIGQKKNVLVHKLITTGTLEEKIDRLIEEKSALTRDIIPDKQEAWITEMDNRQIINLFRLEPA